MKKRSPQPHLQKLGDVLQLILKERKILLTSEKRHLQEMWSKAVGSQIATQTTPERLQKGTLFVKVSSPAWMQQLHFMKEEMIEKINRQAGDHSVRNIFFSIGEVLPSARSDQDPTPFYPESFPLTGRDKKSIERSIAPVSDKELKEILKRVMTKDLIRRKLRVNRKYP